MKFSSDQKKTRISKEEFILATGNSTFSSDLSFSFKPNSKKEEKDKETHNGGASVSSLFLSLLLYQDQQYTTMFSFMYEDQYTSYS